ncbi:MAG: hypothetical protein JNL28_04560 [Planctomycetes bacterium]|nr:hypothetical protein [Planctomycetota bacterium]
MVTAPGVSLGTGTVHVYHHFNGAWQASQQLFASDAQTSDSFGRAIDMDGDWAVIGASSSNGGASVSGSAYVFQRVGNTWIERQKLLPSIPLTQMQFGSAVAIKSDRIVIGASFDSLTGAQVGSAYVYERIGSTWIEVARLQPSDLLGGASFGVTVSIDGDRVACGTSGARAAYVFQRAPQGGWSLQQKLPYTGNSLQLTWNFGGRVVLNGSTLFVSSEDTVGAAIRGGRTYVYEEVGGIWTLVQTLTSLDLESSDRFGIVESKGELAAGVADDKDNGVDSGSAYLFRRTPAGWVQIAKVLPNDGHFQHYFNRTPNISGTMLMVGAPGDDEACPPGTNCETGAVYIFDLALDSVQYGSCSTNSPCANADNHGGCRNSNGRGAVLQASGSGSVAADDLVLEVRELPPFTATMMFVGSAQGAAPLGSGQLVVFGGSLGLHRLGVQFADAQGVIVRPPGLVAYSQILGGSAVISAGQTWNLQCWYRDVFSPCGITNNLTNGLSVAFGP